MIKAELAGISFMQSAIVTPLFYAAEVITKSFFPETSMINPYYFFLAAWAFLYIIQAKRFSLSKNSQK